MYIKLVGWGGVGGLFLCSTNGNSTEGGGGAMVIFQNYTTRVMNTSFSYCAL